VIAIRSILKGYCRSALLERTSTDHRICQRQDNTAGGHVPPDALPLLRTAQHMLEE
jgi:hypothetical protein